LLPDRTSFCQLLGLISTVSISSWSLPSTRPPTNYKPNVHERKFMTAFADAVFLDMVRPFTSCNAELSYTHLQEGTLTNPSRASKRRGTEWRAKSARTPPLLWITFASRVAEPVLVQQRFLQDSQTTTIIYHIACSNYKSPSKCRTYTNDYSWHSVSKFRRHNHSLCRDTVIDML
jgi:hypothetical protein